MVLGLGGVALVGRVERGPLGHRPALQHAVDFEAEIVVVGTRRVLVDDEAALAGRGEIAFGFRGFAEIALAAISRQVRHRASIGEMSFPMQN